MAVPKEAELIATRFRHKSQAAAEKYFLDGMSNVMRNLYGIWSREMIIAEILKRRAEGRSLSSGNRHNINLAAAAVRHFGSWTAALEAAGVPAKQKKLR